MPLQYSGRHNNNNKQMSKNITEQSVFGAYSQNENQVTSALLKILEADFGGG